MSFLPIFEAVKLQNRVARLVQLNIACLRADHQYLILISTDSPAAQAQLMKNRDVFAFQLRELLDVDGQQIEWLHLHRYENVFNCHRWRFEWAGTSPVNSSNQEVPAELLQRRLTEKNWRSYRLGGRQLSRHVA